MHSADGWREVKDPDNDTIDRSGYINAVLRNVCDNIEDIDEDLDDPRDAVRTGSGWARFHNLKLQGGEKTYPGLIIRELHNLLIIEFQILICVKIVM